MGAVQWTFNSSPLIISKQNSNSFFPRLRITLLYVRGSIRPVLTNGLLRKSCHYTQSGEEKQ